MEYMFMPLRRYFDFQGRSRRQEFWLFWLFVFIVTMVLIFLTGTSESTYGDSGFSYSVQSYSPIVWLWMLAIFIPMLAVQVRRFHDQDKSGWFVLFALIPFVGGIVILVFMCLEGTRGPNRFGPDPKGGVAPETFE